MLEKGDYMTTKVLTHRLLSRLPPKSLNRLALKAIQEEADDFLTKHLILVAGELNEISLKGVVHYHSSKTDHSRSLIGFLKIAGTKLPFEFMQSQTLE
jgi:hypothetical protein